ncbi:MAG: group 1 truncated hemoglobin [Deltaproteobacteria bacterium]
MSEPTLFERLGGEWALRPIIQDFVQRMTTDMMIGFFFREVDAKRLEEMEYLFTAKFLGADVQYVGKPIRDAHAPHPIMGGQFDRRRQILEEAIDRHGVAPDIKAAWLEHVDRLRPQVTRDAAGVCIDPVRGDEEL